MTDRTHVYVVLDPDYKPADGMEHVDYSPKIEHGDVFANEERLNPGQDVVAPDGPLYVRFTPGYLGAWGLNDDGQPALPASSERIIQLMMLGSAAEETLRKQLHAAFDLVKEAAEGLKMDDDVRHDLFVRMDQIEKRLKP